MNELKNKFVISVYETMTFPKTLLYCRESAHVGFRGSNEFLTPNSAAHRPVTGFIVNKKKSRARWESHINVD